MRPKKRKKYRTKAGKQQVTELPNQLQTGMPALDSVRKVVNAVSPEGNQYQIMKTTEMDPYDTRPKQKKKRRRKS